MKTMKQKNTQDKRKENLGEFMLRIVTRAIKIAQKEAAIFSRIAKPHYNGVDDDLVTSADLKIQAFHVREIRNWDPEGGLIGEEKALRVEPTVGFARGRYFTDDPVDGTKAYGRKQSTGVSSMLAHVTGGKADAVCIGDINTGEIYQYAPGMPPTRTRFGVKSPLQPNITEDLGKLYVLLDNPPDNFPLVLQKMIRKEKGGVFKDMEVTSGSVGITVARIWKGEVGMIIMRPNSFDTPWDTTPLVGMNAVLGIKHLKLDPETLEICVFDPELPLEVRRKKYIEILVHETRVAQVIEWIEKNR
jgi:fructose-1,6-bisphosphatase/inositol monophosphatase family enzyme